jgi:hypothetical protein
MASSSSPSDTPGRGAGSISRGVGRSCLRRRDVEDTARRARGRGRGPDARTRRRGESVKP